MNTPAVEGLAEKVAAGRNKILSELRKVIVGQDEVVDEVLMALFCGGHCLITRVPGLAKTLLVKTLSQIPLADEINRTPPKTQAALLEAMQEYHVTAAGRTYQLEKPFFVLATQNPIELEGPEPLRVLSGADITAIQEYVRQVLVAEEVVRYAVRLTDSSRPGRGAQLDFIDKWVKWGAGLRASHALVIGAKARALLHGRHHVSVKDIQALAKPILRHRVLPNFYAEAEGITSDRIVDQLLDAVPVPAS